MVTKKQVYKIKESFVYNRFKTTFFRHWEMWKLDDEYYDDLIKTAIKKSGCE